MNPELTVCKYFEHLGYTAEKIAESSDESPDFLVFDDTISFVTELKTKFPSDDELAARQQILDSGNFHNVQEQIVRTNTLSSITRHAAEQLENYGPRDALRVVFLLAMDYLDEARFQQFQATLYGSAVLIDSTKMEASTCFFFGNSDFFRHRDVLDAAIVATDEVRDLLLNPYSPKNEQLRQSSLWARFDGGLVDPIELERQGKAYFMDGDTDRDDEEAVLEYLKQKYHTQTLAKMNMNFLSGTMQV